jgi:nitroreductase
MEKTILFFTIASLAFPAHVFAAGTVKLPAPKMDGGKPLMQALKERRSQRAFSPKVFPDQLLADLLWAANGVNRPDGHKTAPSARNMQEIEIYTVKADGCYLYDPKGNTLAQVTDQDIRGSTGTQDFVQAAPLNLVYVADEGKMKDAGEQKVKWAAADTGFISENVYLFCASEGLVTVVRGSFDEQELSKAMKLRPNQRIILTQTVGYPK